MKEDRTRTTLIQAASLSGMPRKKSYRGINLNAEGESLNIKVSLHKHFRKLFDLDFKLIHDNSDWPDGPMLCGFSGCKLAFNGPNSYIVR